MAEIIEFKDGQLVSNGYVEIDGTQHEIHEAEYTGETPISAYLLNKLQKNLLTHKYIVKINNTTEGNEEITIPSNYKVGQDVLDVYYNGERLIKASTIDTEGHYYEIGEENSISNKIQITSDWETTEGDIFEFVIRGEYSNDT